MTRAALVILVACPLLAQTPALNAIEQRALQQAISEAGNSPVEFERALERHLKLYPETAQRAEIEKGLVKTAIDLNDDRVVLEYGEKVLARDPLNRALLEAVATAMLRSGGKPEAARALEHARRLEQLIRTEYKDDKFVPGGGREVAKRKDEFDRAAARVEILQARAEGLQSHSEQAVQLAEASYQIFPSVEGAREAGRWLAAAGRDREAIDYYAEALSIAGFRAAEPDGANDRARLGELYKKINGSENGLGELILKTYDRTAAQMAARRGELKQYDPNNQLKDPMAFTLASVDGEKLEMSTLAGKILVLDFWATWCGPCRVQHGLYEETKARFKDNPDVMFLSIDADEDHKLVKPFMESQKWTQKAYFDDGLQFLLKVENIPTTIIFGKKGNVVDRMVGYLPDRFVDMLTDRINDALGKPIAPPMQQAISQ
jgi:thiol-disulfide isomerase/thioredoxin